MDDNEWWEINNLSKQAFDPYYPTKHWVERWLY